MSKDELNDSRVKILRMVGLSVLAFLIMLGYSLARPATESLFLEAHTSTGLPLVWLLVAGSAVITVGLFARLLARVELIRLFGWTAAGSAATLALLILLLQAGVPGVHYALYVWKDIYIVLLVETFYSFANAVFPIKTARWAYGLFGVVSSAGSLLGNMAVGGLAERFTTELTLWFLMPILLVMWAICVPLSRRAGAHRVTAEAKVSPSFIKALETVTRSSYLALLVLMIVVLQIVVNLVDYQYNQMVEVAYPDMDERTGVIGQVYAALSVTTVILHGLTGPVLRLVGVPAVLLAVPVILGGGLVALAVVPHFLTAAIVKVTSKCFDYSIFRAAKEILYIPLTYAEKTQGKSIVDVMSYRVAKGAASLLLMALGLLGATGLVMPLTLVMVVIWVFITVVVVRRFRQKVSRDEEMGRERPR